MATLTRDTLVGEVKYPKGTTVHVRGCQQKTIVTTTIVNGKEKYSRRQALLYRIIYPNKERRWDTRSSFTL